MQIDDLRMLIKRFAQQESFSEHCKGGGKISNMEFLPYLAQMGVYLYKKMPTSVQVRLKKDFERRLKQAPIDIRSEVADAGMKMELQMEWVTVFFFLPQTHTFPWVRCLEQNVNN